MSLRHQLGVLGFNSILTLFTRSWRQIPQVGAQSHKTTPLPLQIPVLTSVLLTHRAAWFLTVQLLPDPHS